MSWMRTMSASCRARRACWALGVAKSKVRLRSPAATHLGGGATRQLLVLTRLTQWERLARAAGRSRAARSMLWRTEAHSPPRLLAAATRLRAQMAGQRSRLTPPAGRFRLLFGW